MSEKTRELLGKRVRVTISDDSDINADSGKVIVTGKLLGFGQGGDFEILEDDGFVHYCWPMLCIEEDHER